MDDTVSNASKVVKYVIQVIYVQEILFYSHLKKLNCLVYNGVKPHDWKSDGTWVQFYSVVAGL